MERVDVVVIAGGGTGSEVAFRLGSRGDLRVALAERDKLGGECNHYGCVPTKVMLRSAKLARALPPSYRWDPLPNAWLLPLPRERSRWPMRSAPPTAPLPREKSRELS